MDRLHHDQLSRDEQRALERKAREDVREHERSGFVKERQNGWRCHEAARKAKWMHSLQNVFQRADVHSAGLITTEMVVHILSTDPEASALVGLNTIVAKDMQGRFAKIFEEIQVGEDQMIDLFEFQSFCVKLSGNDGH